MSYSDQLIAPNPTFSESPCGRGGAALPWPVPTCYMDLRLQPWPARRWLPGMMRHLAPLPVLL